MSASASGEQASCYTRVSILASYRAVISGIILRSSGNGASLAVPRIIPSDEIFTLNHLSANNVNHSLFVFCVVSAVTLRVVKNSSSSWRIAPALIPATRNCVSVNQSAQRCAMLIRKQNLDIAVSETCASASFIPTKSVLAVGTLGSWTGTHVFSSLPIASEIACIKRNTFAGLSVLCSLTASAVTRRYPTAKKHKYLEAMKKACSNWAESSIMNVLRRPQIS